MGEPTFWCKFLERDVFVRAYCERVFARCHGQFDTALLMPSHQARARVCFGSVALRPLYLASLVPLMSVVPDLVRDYDEKLRAVLQSCVQGARITDLAWELACLPQGDGGLGIPRLADRADAWFIASPHRKDLMGFAAKTPTLV